MNQYLNDITRPKDNCGFGLIAHRRGEASHHLLETAISALTCMTHRGAIAVDGKTGDGCGLLLQKPDEFLRAIAEQDFGKKLSADYGVGMIFLSKDSQKANIAKETLNKLLSEQSLEVIGWRKVPTDESVLGEIAASNAPHIEQVFVNAKDCEGDVFSRKLFMARRKAEVALSSDKSFYVCSLSNRVISYKGLVMPADLPKFFTELSDSRLKTAICVFHQRFSTNTLPQWSLSQPFRLLAHNGEINTVWGNRNWSVARTPKFKTELLPELESLTPLVNREGSDSSSLDNMLEILISGGMNLFRALRMVIPPAWQNVESMDADLRAFYEYNSMHMEPWDGPAGIVLTEGRYAVCLMDRNGLRPARWVITKNDYITLASEIGVDRHQPQDVVKKGRVGPGEILAIDTQTGEILTTDAIDTQLKTAHPYQEWLYKNGFRLESTLSEELKEVGAFNRETLMTYRKMFLATNEERDSVLRPLAETAQEAVGSMGDDTPMAVLSSQIRSVYDYFRQQFAQVTNPPIDPLRESIVMSLETCLGSECNIFEEKAEHANRVILTSPILEASKFRKLLDLNRAGFKAIKLDLNYSTQLSLKQAIINLTKQAEQAVLEQHTLLILSDRDIATDKLPIHAAMAVGAVHHHLVEKGLRCSANILVETATARDPHHFAVLFGFGATAIYPYLSYEIIHEMITSGEVLVDPIDAFKNYRKGINKGILKILSKMGISTIASYRGAQLFEAVGLNEEIVDLCFRGVASRISGATFEHFKAEQMQLAKSAWSTRHSVKQGGLLKYVHGGEYHAFNPDVVMTLQQAVKTGDYATYRDYANLVNARPVATLRDLFTFKETKSVSLDKVEPIESIIKRFDSAGMSLGALSPEAHEALATAMNRLGARSNSGEGGEDPARFGTEKSSKIKQVASGRFGVTPHYLVNAEVLQIKIAQGAKPGEGGQLPGGKVNELIARLRYSVPGVTLISPPPHHDIYSIEDLAQLIFDLKQVNPDALVSVKLVSEPGVGTIAAGVAKAYADLITISGYDGGTAASPLTSIRYAGSPWEIGLSETHAALRANGLRGKIRLQTDGGLKTGLDVIKAAMLGAESFGFGTTPMVALGCKYLRICHLNNCATGVATQNKALRDGYFIGTVEMAMHFFQFVAMETREWLAKLGFTSLADVIGRADLIDILPGSTEKHQHLKFDNILAAHLELKNQPQYCQVAQNKPFDKGELAEKMVAAALPAIEKKSGGEFEFTISNCDRSIGARLSGEIAKRYGNQGMADTPITFLLKGVAGQSLGAWNVGGLHLMLEGDANDYVGKGMAGGKIVLKLPYGTTLKSQETPIMGNTCLYGATGGELYAAGLAGERFAVRNSGVMAVIEGAGDHCCEYMTGGVVTVLGSTGYNFGAGMTGGFAYVLDMDRTFVDKCNHELIEICRINSESMEAYRSHLRSIIQAHAGETHSEWSLHLLRNFPNYINRFWLVKPKAASLNRLLEAVTKRPE